MDANIYGDPPGWTDADRRVFSAATVYLMEEANLDNFHARVILVFEKIDQKGARAATVNNKDFTKFKIALSKDLKGCNLIRVLSHETVHLWEMLHGHLSQTESGLTYRGREYTFEEVQEHHKTRAGYCGVPWEKFAFDHQDFLYTRVVARLKKFTLGTMFDGDCVADARNHEMTCRTGLGGKLSEPMGILPWRP